MHVPEQKIVIVKTGEPIASMIEQRGSFATIIRGAIGDEWKHEYGEFDARSGDYPDPREASAFIITRRMPGKMKSMSTVAATMPKITTVASGR